MKVQDVKQDLFFFLSIRNYEFSIDVKILKGIFGPLYLATFCKYQGC